MTAAPAGAQYFGGNKVQYRTFDFQVLKTEHFDIYFYPEEKQAAQMSGRLAERWRARLGTLLNHELSGRQPLILYAAHPHFEQTNAIGGMIGEGTGGVTESVRRRIVLPLGASLFDTDHVIGHELVHAYQFDITSSKVNGGQAAGPGAMRLPLWFIEGMAEYLSLGPIDANTTLWVRDAVLQEKLPRIKDLYNPEYFPYRWGQAFWAYIAGTYGDAMVGRLLRQASRLGSPEQAIEQELKMKPDELSEQWHRALQASVARVVQDRQPAREFGRLLAGSKEIGGQLNVSPALSPDGRRVAFLSERSVLSIDLYIADTQTGEILDRLSHTGVDPHFSSLQFIQSAGAFNASGDRFAFAAVAEGRPVIAIYDTEKREVVQELKITNADEVFNPTWSPDGRRIAMCAMRGGFTDLVVADVESGAVRTLTDDAFADIHPAWSPDGRRIAFATDRFTTNLQDLAAGEYRLGLIDPDSGRIEQVRAFDRGKHINPQWTGDGSDLVFINDRDGVPNTYRVSVRSGELRQLTDLQTGISGITESSPALSAATRADVIAFSVYESGRHQLYAMSDPRLLAGVEPGPVRDANAAVLPPLQRKDEPVVAALHQEEAGLPPRPSTDVEPYHAGLQLDNIGAPSIAVGADRFGAFGGGGVALSFSDTLGDHNLFAALQFNTSLSGSTSFKDFGGALGYTNLRHRWNWGVYGQQFPYRSGYVGQAEGVAGGTPVLVQQTTLFRQTDRSVGAMTAYPFNQAQRVEFNAAYRNLGFDVERETLVYSPITGELLDRQTTSASLGDALNLGQFGAALVYDTTSFGATSPVAGQRYRLEASPTVGSIDFTGVLADYRRYFMPVPFYTIAARVMHYGRYGSGAEDERLTPLFIGYPSLVRGYDVDTFDASDCGPDPSGGCTGFDRLIGSRMAVANLEFRFPLLRPFGVRSWMYGPVPTEVAFFADAGLAWDKETRVNLLGRGDGRKPVSSAGVALRVNALGFAVLELDLVRPFQRPEQGWMFQFSLTPGF